MKIGKGILVTVASVELLALLSIGTVYRDTTSDNHDLQKKIGEERAISRKAMDELSSYKRDGIKKNSELERELENLRNEMGKKIQSENDLKSRVEQDNQKIGELEGKLAKKAEKRQIEKTQEVEEQIQSDAGAEVEERGVPLEGGSWISMTVEASAYTTVENGDSMGGSGLTATGTIPMAFRTIAVDPSIIPYGSQVRYNGNIYIAEDTGGMIVGNRIDIFMGSLAECTSFGRQNIQIEVLN